MKTQRRPPRTLPLRLGPRRARDTPFVSGSAFPRPGRSAGASTSSPTTGRPGESTGLGRSSGSLPGRSYWTIRSPRREVAASARSSSSRSTPRPVLGEHPHRGAEPPLPVPLHRLRRRTERLRPPLRGSGASVARAPARSRRGATVGRPASLGGRRPLEALRGRDGARVLPALGSCRGDRRLAPRVPSAYAELDRTMVIDEATPCEAEEFQRGTHDARRFRDHGEAGRGGLRSEPLGASIKNRRRLLRGRGVGPRRGK